jgi:hypothetical protein
VVGAATVTIFRSVGTTRDDFSALRPTLEADYDVLAVDLPGLWVVIIGRW